MMRITLRHRARLVAKKSLHLIQINAALNEPRGESMPHIVETEVWNSGPIAHLTGGSE